RSPAWADSTHTRSRARSSSTARSDARSAMAVKLGTLGRLTAAIKLRVLGPENGRTPPSLQVGGTESPPCVPRHRLGGDPSILTPELGAAARPGPLQPHS